MTEKRFEFFKDGDKIYCRDVLDDFNYPMYDESTAKDIVNFMNFLYDEKNEVSRNFYRFYKNDYCNLEEENEQLKDALNQRTDQCDKYYKKNKQLKKGMVEVVDRYIKNVECNPPSSARTYMKIKRALDNIREDLRSLIEDFE